MEWESADKRLPGDDATVLIALDDGVRIEPNGETVWLGYFDGQWRLVDGEPVAVTHWSRLPDAPR